MKMLTTLIVTLALFAPLALAEADAPRDAATIQSEIDALEKPRYDRERSREPGYREAYTEQTHAYHRAMADLAVELYQVAPETPGIAKLLKSRWSVLAQLDNRTPDALAEIDAYLAAHPDDPHHEDIMATMVRFTQQTRDWALIETNTERFIAAYPQDVLGAWFLMFLGDYHPNADRALGFYQRAAENYADLPPGKTALGRVRQFEKVGQPFELAFTDAITDTPIDIKNMKGKVVVIDFWATWCGPCVAEIPKLKALYEQYHDQGFEIIGISLDREDGGLDKLKTFVADRELPWPQFFEKALPKEQRPTAYWGINAIPALFIIDADGNLYSTRARGHLETLIPELIEKRDAS